MRRWLLILLAFVMPMQFASATAASFCQHETGVAKHFGHHEHKHQAAAQGKASDSGSSQAKTGLGDPDCEYCHLGAGTTLATPALVVAGAPSRDTFLAESGLNYRSHVPCGPERPDRSERIPAARFCGGVAFAPLLD